MREEYKKFIGEGSRRAEGVLLATSGRMFDGMSGMKASVGAGSSLDFLEHRNYAPGDDTRMLDWNVYARTEKLTLKMFRDETEPKVDLLFDASKSMNLAASRKAEASLGILGLLATAAQNGHFSTTCHMAGADLRPVANGGKAPLLWDGVEFDGETGMADIFDREPLMMRYRSVRIVISDLLWPCEPERFLRKIAKNAAAVAVIQILGTEDLEPTASGMVTLRDSETGADEKIFLDQTAIDSYKNSLSALRQLWESSCRGLGAVFASVNADELLESWDFTPLAEKGIVM